MLITKTITVRGRPYIIAPMTIGQWRTISAIDNTNTTSVMDSILQAASFGLNNALATESHDGSMVFPDPPVWTLEKLETTFSYPMVRVIYQEVLKLSMMSMEEIEKSGESAAATA